MKRANVVLAAMLLALSVWGYMQLPDRIPTHFNASGEADGWGRRVSFLVMPVIGIVTLAGLEFTKWLCLRNPGLANMPDKKRFLELPAVEQRRVLEGMLDLLDYAGAGTLVLFSVIQLSTYRTALGHDASGLLTGMLIATLVGTLALPVFMLISVQRRMDEAVKRVKMGGEIR